MSDFSGRCLCGAVQFEIGGPLLWCGHCHCEMCRRAHGAAFVTWVGTDIERFRVSSGTDQLAWFESSPKAQRGFCRDCGSTLFFRGEAWPGEMHVVRSNFDSEVDLQPQGHGYWETHVDWFEFGDSLPRKTSQ